MSSYIIRIICLLATVGKTYSIGRDGMDDFANSLTAWKWWGTYFPNLVYNQFSKFRFFYCVCYFLLIKLCSLSHKFIGCKGILQIENWSPWRRSARTKKFTISLWIILTDRYLLLYNGFLKQNMRMLIVIVAFDQWKKILAY